MSQKDEGEKILSE